MIIELDALSPNQIYHMLTQAVIPRPIAWVLSENADQSFNLAPFSYFNAIASAPPLVLLSLGKRPDGTPKDTRANIEARQDYVIHIADGTQLEPLNQSAASLAPGQSEVDELGLQTVEFPGSRLPRLANAPIALACRLYKLIEIGDVPQTLIIGQVDRLYVSDDAAKSDAKGRLSIDAKVVDPLARLGAREYAAFGEVIVKARPS
ncbi:MAG: flavin reductase family protein [Deltaproteobacteria bacterium]|nr:flavin reductase family protein [Deltaproteobacteria bacterium]